MISTTLSLSEMTAEANKPKPVAVITTAQPIHPLGKPKFANNKPVSKPAARPHMAHRRYHPWRKFISSYADVTELHTTYGNGVSSGSILVTALEMPFFDDEKFEFTVRALLLPTEEQRTMEGLSHDCYERIPHEPIPLKHENNHKYILELKKDGTNVVLVRICLYGGEPATASDCPGAGWTRFSKESIRLVVCNTEHADSIAAYTGVAYEVRSGAHGSFKNAVLDSRLASIYIQQQLLM